MPRWRMGIALITRADEGLGLDVALRLGRLGMSLILGADTADAAGRAAEQVKREGGYADGWPLDVNDPQSISWTIEFIMREFSQLDVLVNMPVRAPDGRPETREVNRQGMWQAVERFAPVIQRGDHRRVVNVATNREDDLKALTRHFAMKLRRDQILVNAADADVESILAAITVADGGVTGHRFRAGSPGPL